MSNIIKRIEAVLEKDVRPTLLAHGGNLELLSFEDGIARVRFTGACSGCPSADLTMEMVVREKLTAALPKVKDVVLEQAVSEEMLEFARTFIGRRKREQEEKALAESKQENSTDV